MRCARFVATHRRSRHAGFALIDVALALAILGLIALALAREALQREQARSDKTAAEYLLLVRNGLQRYLDDYRAELLNAAAIPGVADSLQPTLDELRTLNMLSPTLGDTGPAPSRLSYSMRVDRLPAGCTPGADCTDLQGILWSSEWNTTGADDVETAERARLAEIAFQMGIDAAVPNPATPSELIGPDGVWPVANPVAGNPLGIVVARAGFGSMLDLNALLPRDGTRPMVGNLNINDNDILNARTTNTQQVAFSATATANTACTTANQITAGADGAPLVCLSSTWRRIGWRYAAAGAACTGTEIAADTSGQALVCRGSTFVALADRLPRIVDVQQTVTVHGDTLTKPTCGSGGAPNIVLIPVDPGIDDAVASGNPSRNRLRATTADNGTSWTVSLGLVDSTNTFYTAGAGGSYGFQAIARLQCIYS